MVVKMCREFKCPESVLSASPKRLAGKCGQNECRLVDVLAVVLAQLLLFLGGPGAKRLLDVAVAVLAADHEANLARRVGWDGGVRVLGDRED